MEKENNLLKEIEPTPIQSNLSHVFEFKKEPATGLKKFVNTVKGSGTAILFGAGVATGYFLYNHTPMFELLKYIIQFGLDAVALLLVVGFLIELKNAPKDLTLKEKITPFLRNILFAAAGCLSLASLISVLF